MLEADITSLVNTIFLPFMPVISVFIDSAIMLCDLSWNDDDDDGSGLITPINSYAPQWA